MAHGGNAAAHPGRQHCQHRIEFDSAGNWGNILVITGVSVFVFVYKRLGKWCTVGTANFKLRTSRFCLFTVQTYLCFLTLVVEIEECDNTILAGCK